MKRKVRLYFKFKGSMHRKFHNSSVDWEIHIEDHWSDEEIFRDCSEVLGCLITKGLVDVECTHMVDDFELLRYEIDPTGEAEKDTFGITKF